MVNCSACSVCHGAISLSSLRTPRNGQTKWKDGTDDHYVTIHICTLSICMPITVGRSARRFQFCYCTHWLVRKVIVHILVGLLGSYGIVSSGSLKTWTRLFLAFFRPHADVKLKKTLVAIVGC